MSKSAILVVIAMLVMCVVSCDNIVVDKDRLQANDYRLFQETPSWELAKAVKHRNLDKVRGIIQNGEVDINYREPIFGGTLLMLTVLNDDYESCQALLTLGADPNIHDKYDGTSAIIDAAGKTETKNNNGRFLKLLLKYGANPNDEEVGQRRPGNRTRDNPLLNACTENIEKVKVLVESGANINYQNEFGETAIGTALIVDKYDIVLYLLQKGANYQMPLDNVEGKNYYIGDQLRLKLHPLGSEEYTMKMKIVAFLRENGVEYRNISIPDYAIQHAKEEYPRSWNEYLDKY